MLWNDNRVGEYSIETTSLEKEDFLIDYLKFNNFKYEDTLENCGEEEEYVIVINLVHKIYYKIKSFLASSPIMSEEEFLEIVYYDKYAIHGKFYSENGDLAYDGYTVFDRPKGFGISYYPNGNKHQEGVFNYKGLVEGKEYYSNGQLKFEGIMVPNSRYGPNFPLYGNYYSKEGELIFSGKFHFFRGGVGYPLRKGSVPDYPILEKDRPHLIFGTEEEGEIEENSNNETGEYPMTFEEFEEKVLELFFEYYSEEFVEKLKKQLEELEKEDPNYMKGLYEATCWRYDSPHLYGKNCKKVFEKEYLRHYPVYDLRTDVGLEDGFRG